MIYYIIGHLLGDFVVQTDSMADRKSKNIRVFMMHCIAYSISMLFVSTVGLYTNSILDRSILQLHLTMVLVISILHAIIDILKIKLEKRYLFFGKSKVFFIDQFIHVSTILVTATMLKIPLMNTDSVVDNYLIHVLGFLLVGSPMSVCIRILLEPFSNNIKVNETVPNNSIDVFGMPNAGKYIGMCERLLLLFFLLIGKMEGLALVFSIKVVSRYKKISEDVSFAEYFVIGNSLSLIATIIAYILIKALLLFV